MTLKLNAHQNTWQLTGETGMIDDNVGFIDFTDPDGVKKIPPGDLKTRLGQNFKTRKLLKVT